MEKYVTKKNLMENLKKDKLKRILEIES